MQQANQKPDLNHVNQLDRDHVSDLLCCLEESIKSLCGMGYASAVQSTLDAVAPKKEAPQITLEAADKAYNKGRQAYRDGVSFHVSFYNQPSGQQPYIRAGWTSEALECAHLKSDINDVFKYASESQYYLEAAIAILQHEAAHTKISKRRHHMLTVAAGVFKFTNALSKITGKTSIQSLSENTREGQQQAGASPAILTNATPRNEGAA